MEGMVENNAGSGEMAPDKDLSAEDSTEQPRGFGGTPDPDAGGENRATPEEQQDYELIAVRARKIIFGSGKEKILKMLGSSESPAKGMGKVGAMIIKALTTSGKEQGRDISPDAAINAAAVILDDLNSLAKAKNVFKYDDQESEDSELQDAMLWGVKFYGDGMVAKGEITPQFKKMARNEMVKGMAEEQEQGPKPKKMASAVNQAVNDQAMAGPGVVNGAMQEEI